MQPTHPGKKHIRVDVPYSYNAKVWAEQNRDRIQSFMIEVEVGPRNQYIDVYYRPGEETVIIEEVLRYAGAISVCRTGSNLDQERR